MRRRRRGRWRNGIQGLQCGGCDGVVGIGVVGEEVLNCWVVVFCGGGARGVGSGGAGDEGEEGGEL